MVHLHKNGTKPSLVAGVVSSSVLVPFTQGPCSAPSGLYLFFLVLECGSELINSVGVKWTLGILLTSQFCSLFKLLIIENNACAYTQGTLVLCNPDPWLL